MSLEGYRVSVVIRTRDTERHFHKLLRSLSQQTLHPSEIVVVDNFSSESKLDEMINLLLLAKRQAFDNDITMKFVPVTNEEFSYAYTANAGVFASNCDLACLTNGHSLPTSKEWLASGVTHFRNRDVAGVGAYTLSHANGTAWEKLAFDLGWRRLNEFSKAYVKDRYFSTVNCILRKSLWKEYPFDERLPNIIHNAGMFGGEDFDWGLEMLARGYKVIVEPRFDVRHSHGEAFSQLAPKYLIWRRIRKKVRSLSRPRKSYTRLSKSKPFFYEL